MMPPTSMPFLPDTSMDPSLNFALGPDDPMSFASMSAAGAAMNDPTFAGNPFGGPMMKDQNNQWPPNAEQQGRREKELSPSSRLPSRRDVKAFFAMQQQDQQQQQQSLGSTRPSTPSRADALAHFANFANTMGTVNADISGVAQTLADYLAWVRKRPDECNEAVLEIFEARAREVAEMAASRTAAALEEATTSVSNIAGPENELCRVGSDIARASQERVDFFHSGYEIQRSLAEQCSNRAG